MGSVDFVAVADALAGPGWIVVDDFVDASLAAALRAEAVESALTPARVGAGGGARFQPEIRGDRTRWLQPESATAAQAQLLARFDALREALNAMLFAGLVEFEAHFAHYPPGARYGLHRDRFRSDDRRVVSCVLYLNPDWPQEAGGALRLYDESDAALAEIAPSGGRAVLFLSDRFPHEVLPADRDRYSIAAWFLRRGR
jgi:SM-20-related protein